MHSLECVECWQALRRYAGAEAVNGTAQTWAGYHSREVWKATERNLLTTRNELRREYVAGKGR